MSSSIFKVLRQCLSCGEMFESQKLLVKNGFNIQIDGLYKLATSNAIKSFEEKNNFFPDGKLDILTLSALLNK